jgi:Mn2+/Fe2+ NRAMP family transporter
MSHATPTTPRRGDSPTSARNKSWLKTLAMAGPAFVVGAWQFGPGNLTTAVQSGSEYGYGLIWVIAVSTIFMLFYADMSVRLGICTPVSLITSIKELLGRRVGLAAGLGVFFITLMFSVGNAVGSGLGLSLAFGGSPIVWTVVCTVGVGLILLFRNVYGVIEKVLLVIVALMGIAFVASAVIAQPDWLSALGGMVPTLPPDSQLLVVALVGTNFSINAAFFTSYGTHERRRTRDEYRQTTVADTIPGIVAPGVMTALVIVVAAAVLGRANAEASSMGALAKVFEPLAGPVGSLLFALGLAGAAFSSMIANATAGGTMLSDSRGRGPSPSTRVAKITSAAILAFGLIVTLSFQRSPVQLIVVAQALTVVVAPMLALLLLVMSNKGELMGDLRNRWWQNVFGVLGFCSVLALSALLIYELV